MVAFSWHDLRFETERLILRPFFQADCEIALPYYHDPEFLFAMEGEPPTEPITVEYLEDVARIMARQGYLFAIVEKVSGRVIGEVCLQWMNLERADVRENEKVMRLPIGIWDKTLWGKGYGKEVVSCLMRYAFEELNIDRFCAMDVKVDNVRSRALWLSLGLKPVRELDKSAVFDFEISKEIYFYI